MQVLAYHSSTPISNRACGLSGMHSAGSLLKGAVGERKERMRLGAPYLGNARYWKCPT